MKAYQIKDWHVHYESSDSRKTKFLRWVKIPNKHDGKGYRRVLAHPDGIRMFSGFILMVQEASKMPIRGLLADENGPLTSEDLSIATGAPADIFELCFKCLIDNKIGWLEEIELEKHPDASGSRGEERRLSSKRERLAPPRPKRRAAKPTRKMTDAEIIANDRKLQEQYRDANNHRPAQPTIKPLKIAAG